MIDKKPDITVLGRFPQCEWDFRNLFEDEDQLRIATMYEYLRECPWISDTISKWLDTPIGSTWGKVGSSSQCSFGENRETTFRELLSLIAKERARSGETTKEMKRRFIDIPLAMPEKLKGHPFAGFFWTMLDWPTPYLQVNKTDSYRHLKAISGDLDNEVKKGLLGSEKIPNFPMSPLLTSDNEENVLIKVDWNKSDLQLKEEFSRFLKLKRPQSNCTSREGRQRPLKWLSAYRLNSLYKRHKRSAGYLLDDLNLFLGDDVDSKPTEELIPFYKDHPSFWRASNNAMQHIFQSVAVYWNYEDSDSGMMHRELFQWIPDIHTLAE